jgi:pumilio family protein 6
MQHLLELINMLVQKKATGFTMLHDAMLQYFLNTTPGSSEASEFLELIKGDEAGDLVKNLAFTKSGARLMCLALAYANAKDRKVLLRMYRDTIKLLAGDVNGHTVLLAAYEVIDDTKLSSKLIFPELLGQTLTEPERHEELLQGANHLTARIPLLYLFAGDRVKWLLTDTDHQILEEVRAIRQQTSKKDAAIRRQELVGYASPTLLEFIAAEADSLSKTSFGCQAVTEILFGAEGDKTGALASVAAVSKSEESSLKESAAVGRMLKSLVQGGRFNPASKTIERVQPALGFAGILYEQIKDEVMTWATKYNPFIIVAMVETEEFEQKDELLKTLRKNKKLLEGTANSPVAEKDDKCGPARSAAKLLLERL